MPKNIYGVTKAAAEDLCQLAHRNQGLPCLVLRTSRFFPEADDDGARRAAYADDNLKANEYLFRRVDIEDVVEAHLLALEKAPAIGFGRYIVSATTPFRPEDLAELRRDAPAVVRRRVPGHEAEYARRGWRMLPSIDRVYVNDRARAELGWQPRHDFRAVIDRLQAGGGLWSPLARLVGSKGYHAETFAEGPIRWADRRPSPSREQHAFSVLQYIIFYTKLVDADSSWEESMRGIVHITPAIWLRNGESVAGLPGRCRRSRRLAGANLRVC